MPALTFGISAVTDELSQDFASALDRIASFGIRHVEIRTLWGKNVVSLSEQEATAARALLDERGMRAILLNGPIFKCDVDEEHPTSYVDSFFPTKLSYLEHVKLLRRTLHLADRFGASMVRVFSFWRHPLAWEAMAERFQRPLELAASAGITLALENIGECNAATSAEIVRFFDLIRSPHIRLIWDPGNALWAGEKAPFPAGYQAVKTYVSHAHVKDLTYNTSTGEVVLKPIGQGEIDYAGQFRALIADDYHGFVSLEPEYEAATGGREAGTVEAWQGMKAILQEVASA
jgi:sugar phosphate isomerase/epimerase